MRNRLVGFRWLLGGSRGLGPAVAAVVMWSLAPALGELAARVPSLQLTASCLIVAAIVTTPFAHLGDRRPVHGTAAGWLTWLVAPVLMLGAVGCYFWALRRAPAGEVTLVTYTWPVMFVVVAELLRHRRVGGSVWLGCALAFTGAGLVLVPAGADGLASWPPYVAALTSGLCWAAFSLLAGHQAAPLGRLLPPMCFVAAAWGALGHLVIETALWPLPATIGFWIVLIGAGPYGIAFVLWDRAVRQGPAAMVGTLPYAVPVLSGGLLVACGLAVVEWKLPVAAIAVILGCLLAGRSARSSAIH